MKKLLFSVLLLLGCSMLHAQHEYTIEGHVEDVRDGAVISLFINDGSVGSVVATDTIRNGTFYFKRTTGENGLDKLSLMCPREANFPPMPRVIYATPNAKIKVTGTNNLIYSWKVDSSVKEQQEHDLFMEDSRDLWDEFQRLSIKEREMHSASKTELKAISAKIDSISALINKRELQLLQETPMTTVWMEKLHSISYSVKYDPQFPNKKEVQALYNKLNEEQKASITGQEIAVNLFPPTVVKEGDTMVDTDLFDLNGKVYHLADFKGKYILLDFWSSGCGPCVMALPEMKEIQEQYRDRLTIISLSVDSKSRWTAASVKHDMTWLNLSDLKQSAGLYAKYGVDGIPNYVLISPEGKIMKMWSGYGKGSLKVKMRRYLDVPKRETSITQQKGIKIANYPTVKSANTDILEIKQVELKDTATVIHFNAYHIPKYWIQVSPNIKIEDEKGTSFVLKTANGITPGEHFFLPESGQTEFSLTFEPLPQKTKSFNLTEGKGENDWQIIGVKLSK